MSTTFPPPTPTPSAAQGAPSRTGEAVHEDLYKVTPDPAAEREHLRGQARTLGLGFFVFFSLIIGGLSLLFNGAFSGGYAARVAAPPGTRADADAMRLLAAQRAPSWTVLWSDGESTRPQVVDLVHVREDDPKAADLKGLVRVRVEAHDEADRIADLARLWVAPKGHERVRGVELTPDPEHLAVAVPSLHHAARDAQLLWRTIPTRYVITIGAVMGLLGVLVPGLLIPFYGFWMRFVAAPLGWFNTRLILGLVFFLMFTPIALFLWLRRALNPSFDALDRADRPGSYWKQRPQPRPSKHFERTF